VSASRRALTAVAAVLAAAAPVGLSSASATTHPASSGAPSLAASLGADRASDVSIARSPSTGLVRFIGTTAGHPLARPAGLAPTATGAAVATAFVHQHGALFGLSQPAAQLSTVAATAAAGGGTVARFHQLVAGYPVVGGDLVVAVTRDGRVSYVSGETVPEQQQLSTARLTAAQARRIAVAATAKAERVPRRALHASAATEAVYAPSVLGVRSAAPTSLVYRVEVDETVGGVHAVRELVLVDAARGAVALRFNQVEQGAAEAVCDAKDFGYIDDPTCPPDGAPDQVSRTVTNPGSSAVADVRDAFTYARSTYNFYNQVVGDASKVGIKADGGNRALNSTVRLCDPSVSSKGNCVRFDNAFWDGWEMVYGDGYASADDVVAHELTHGVTEHTSNLLYLYQSGAINESMSDVMGELVDQWNGRATDTEANRWELGEDLPIGVLRDMADPTTPSADAGDEFTRQPAKMTSPLYYDKQVDIPDTGQAFPDDNGGVHINSGVGNKAAYLIVDGGTFNNVTVPGLGGADPATRPAAIVKAAQIYYKVDQTLTSGADYADLGRVLSAACDSLVGGTAGITDDDCATVRAAVEATEMAKQPTKATAPEAPVCATGFPMSSDWYDDFENTSSGRWAKWPTGNTGPWYYPASRNIYGEPQVYTTSGKQAIWGDDPDPELLSEFGVRAPRDGTMTMTHAVTVPTGKPSYLRFNQAYQFEWYRSFSSGGQTLPALYADGGRVDYTVDNGKHWLSAQNLFDSGGYNHTMRGFDQSQQKQIYSFRGFGGDSHGYVSSRLTLTSLAGHTVRFRFRVTSDATVGAFGWWVDDVRFYTCGAKPAAPTHVTATPGFGQETVSWSAPTDHGTSPIEGYVVTVSNDSTTLATVTDTTAATRSVTISGLPAGKDLRTTVVARNAAGSSPAGAASLLGTGLRIGVSDQSIPSGQPITISGRLVKAGTSTGLGGRRVGLYRADVGSSTFAWVTSTTTGPQGYYTFHRSPTADGQFQTRFIGATPYQGTLSATRAVDVS
jgi:bacillolysin